MQWCCCRPHRPEHRRDEAGPLFHGRALEPNQLSFHAHGAALRPTTHTGGAPLPVGSRAIPAAACLPASTLKRALRDTSRTGKKKAEQREAKEEKRAKEETRGGAKKIARNTRKKEEEQKKTRKKKDKKKKKRTKKRRKKRREKKKKKKRKPELRKVAVETQPLSAASPPHLHPATHQAGWKPALSRSPRATLRFFFLHYTSRAPSVRAAGRRARPFDRLSILIAWRQRKSA